MGRKALLLAALIPLFIFLSPVSVYATRKQYIVYLGAHSHGRDASHLDHQIASESHYDLLGSFLGGNENAKDALIYSYNKHINGFAVNLEDHEAAKIADHPQVISVFESKTRMLHTTHSWDMLRLERHGRVPQESLWTKARFGEDVIVANLDTGVWPESESFRDDGMGPVPARWKGVCEVNTKDGVPCNRKLIGARFFNQGPLAALGKNMNATYRTPRDTQGHGTHTLSTAAGSPVPGVSIYGLANGTAKGGSPGARVASYKVCWPPIDGVLSECNDVDILAAFDAAIDDGVDVLSISLGGTPLGLFEDAMAIGAFHAVKEGIVVVCSAGNDGPVKATATNLSPWMMTVGASTVDREFQAYLNIGNGLQLKGQSLSEEKLEPWKPYSLIRSEDAAFDEAHKAEANLCFWGTLDPEKVKGKIVVCLRGNNTREEKGRTAWQAGGAGVVLVNANLTQDDLVADPYPLPAVHIPYCEGLALYSYLNSTRTPLGSISPPMTTYGVKPSPTMAGFSSRGPNILNPEILKPDIVAPGAGILAAMSQSPGAAEYPYDDRRPPYALMYGTSMACPHVAGVAGLLKKLYPAWSPAMIRSAVMTTARAKDNMLKPIREYDSKDEATPFGYGSGYIRPNHAMDPGLVYDTTTEDYIKFLCSFGYNSTRMRLFTATPYPCPPTPMKLENLNYPSITVPNLRGQAPAMVRRRLKNVGRPSTYRVQVKEPHGFSLVVRPNKLKFQSFGEEKEFVVTVKKKGTESISEEYGFGSLVWSDGKHYVRSPIVVKSASASAS